jgi:hypothetical protein
MLFRGNDTIPHEIGFSHVEKKLEEIMLAIGPLDYKYRRIFKFKRNEKMLLVVEM